MLGHDIRTRLILTAVLPVMLVSVALTALFLIWRSDALEMEHAKRQREVARQLGLAVEYPLFVGNTESLRVLLEGAAAQHQAQRLLLLDAHGRVLTAVGDVGLQSPFVLSAHELMQQDRSAGRDWLAQPVLASKVVLDDVYEDRASTSADHPRLMGQVVLAFGRADVQSARVRLLTWGLVLGGMGMALGVGLALWLSRGVMRPIERVKALIARVGAGDFGSATSLQPVDWVNQPLGGVIEQLHIMAGQLAHVHERLQSEVASATDMLRQRKEEAEQAAQAKSQFLAAASHDLRQPMQAIGMFVTRLMQLPHDVQTGELLAQLEHAVFAMQDLLDGLLDLSRLEARAVQIRVQPVKLLDLVQRVIDDVTPAARERGLNLRVHVRPSLAVSSDPTLLQRIVLNLVSNAVKYTESGGVLIGARLTRHGCWVRLQVWDTGVGIAPAHQALVFREFYRVDAANTPRRSGMGLGLSIVQRSAQLLGHSVSVMSRPGRGSVFEVLLPVAPSARLAPAEPAEPSPAALGQFASQVVLVVEDDTLVRAAMVGLLTAWGLRVIEVSDAAGAMQELVAGAVPDAVLCDYRLPGAVNGIDLIHQMRACLGPDLVAVLITGDTQPELMIEARAAGLTLLHKPVRPAKLRALLRSLLSVAS